MPLEHVNNTLELGYNLNQQTPRDYGVKEVLFLPTHMPKSKVHTYSHDIHAYIHTPIHTYIHTHTTTMHTHAAPLSSEEAEQRGRGSA